MALAVASLVFVGCPAEETGTINPPGTGGSGDGGSTGGNLPHTLSSISVTPLNSVVELDLEQPDTAEFQALGNFEDGTTEDFTASATWSVDNAALGTIDAGTLSIPAFSTTAAESSIISAEFEGLIGEAQITVVAYRQSGTQQDFFFVLPFEDPAGQQTKPLDFSTDIPALDVFFMMDTTGSMQGEINNLQSALTGTIIPGIENVVSNSQYGAGVFEDFPIDPYGSLMGSDCGIGGSSNPDQPFKLFTIEYETVFVNMNQVVR